MRFSFRSNTSVLGSILLPSYIRQRPLCDNRVGTPVVLYGLEWQMEDYSKSKKAHLPNKQTWTSSSGRLILQKRKIIRKIFCGMLSHYSLMSCFFSKKSNPLWDHLANEQHCTEGQWRNCKPLLHPSCQLPVGRKTSDNLKTKHFLQARMETWVQSGRRNWTLTILSFCCYT